VGRRDRMIVLVSTAVVVLPVVSAVVFAAGGQPPNPAFGGRHRDRSGAASRSHWSMTRGHR
jgi:hypothetical protein